MTRNDLIKAYYIGKEIESWKKEEKELKSCALRRKISEKLLELEKKKQEIFDFVMSIDDPQTRLIVKLRCFDLLSWNAVADRVGGMNSEYTVKKRFYRFLEKAGV
jgi:hypothetical protein